MDILLREKEGTFNRKLSSSANEHWLHDTGQLYLCVTEIVFPTALMKSKWQNVHGNCKCCVHVKYVISNLFF